MKSATCLDVFGQFYIKYLFIGCYHLVSIWVPTRFFWRHVIWIHNLNGSPGLCYTFIVNSEIMGDLLTFHIELFGIFWVILVKDKTVDALTSTLKLCIFTVRL